MAFPKDFKTVKDFLTSTGTQLSSMVDSLDEPFKTQFKGVKDEWDKLLSSMAPTDMTKVASEANANLDSLWCCLMSMQSALGMVSSQLSQVRSKYASALPAEEVEKRIKDAIDTKVKAGELFPTDRVTQLCSDAKANVEKTLRAEFAKTEADAKAATAAAEKAAGERAKLISGRASTLASKKFPLPGEDVLSMSEEQFTKQEAEAQKRFEKLTQAGATDAELLASVIWLSPEDYAKQEKVILKSLACRKNDGAEIFALPPAQGQPSEAPAWA